jgi:hypothetical protein
MNRTAPWPVARRLRAALGAGRAGESGQSLLEFAFVLPMLLILIIGMVEFARLYQQYQAITDAAREGARIGVIAAEDHKPAEKPALVEAAIKSALTRNGLAASEPAVSVPKDACAPPTGSTSVVQIYLCGVGPPAQRGEPATVVIRAPYEFQFLGPFIGWATGDRTLTLATSTVMRTE